jgi:phage FluMu protein Com
MRGIDLYCSKCSVKLGSFKLGVVINIRCPGCKQEWEIEYDFCTNLNIATIPTYSELQASNMEKK